MKKASRWRLRSMTGMYGVIFRPISQPSNGPLPYALSAARLSGVMPSVVPARDTSVRVAATSDEKRAGVASTSRMQSVSRSSSGLMAYAYRAGPCLQVSAACGSVGEMLVGLTGAGSSGSGGNAASSAARYSATGRDMLSPARSSSAASAPFSFFSRLASAMIVLPSTATSSPATSPAAAHRATTCSNSRRCRPQARKRPCRFLEKVEWSGTRSARSSRQNQR